MIIIEHEFYPLGATAHRLPDDTICFISPSDDDINHFNAWYTGMNLKDKEILPFLGECYQGEYTTLGSGFYDTWIEIMKQLNDFSK